MFTIRVSRSWLAWGPAMASAAALWGWLVAPHASWEWLRNLNIAFAIAVCVGVLIWGLASVVFLTRRGFWVPFEGHGRWVDVVARDGFDLTMRSSLRYGIDEVISFDRVGGARLQRRLDRALPGSLPGPSATEPHPEWKKALDERAELLLRRLAVAADVPAHTRDWVHPSAEPFATHTLRLRFAPALNGRQVTVTLNSFEWYPVVEVDGLFASFPDEDEEDGELRSGHRIRSIATPHSYCSRSSETAGGSRWRPGASWPAMTGHGSSTLGSCHEDRCAQ